MYKREVKKLIILYLFENLLFVFFLSRNNELASFTYMHILYIIYMCMCMNSSKYINSNHKYL